MLKFRIFLWSCLFFILGFFIYNGITPGGHKVYCQNFEKQNYFIGKLSPETRVGAGNKNINNALVGNPIYFSLKTLRKFDEATINLKYKNSNDLPLIEAGILVDNTIWRYDLRGIENKLIEQLVYVWDVFRDNDLIFLQREKKYNSISEFLDNPPDSAKIATYNYTLDMEYILSDYRKRAENEIISNIPALRGSYQFFTYIKDEEFNFEFEFLDLNENKDEDQINLHLYYNDTLIKTAHLDDDGIFSDNGSTTKSRIINMQVNDLPEGVYKVELRANDDIVTQKINTKQNKISFLNKLYLYRGGKSNFSIYTDSKKIQSKTVYPGSLQILKSGSSEMIINETYKQFEMNMPETSSTTKYYEILIQKDGLILTGDGVFSFNPRELLNPRFRRADYNLDINNGNIDYILARYNLVQKNEELRITSAVFDLKNAYRHTYKYQLVDSGEYNFLISIPDLKLEDNKRIEIEEICVNLKGKSLKEKILSLTFPLYEGREQ